MLHLLEQYKPELLKLFLKWELSLREADVALLLLSDFTSNKEIADKLNISPITVRNHLDKVYKKSSCKNKNQLLVTVLHHFLKQTSELNMFYRQPRVLVVDDEEHICEIIETSLTALGASVDTTSNPNDVEKMLRYRPYDFVICDIKMPGQNGQQIIKKVKKLYHVWPKFIVITGYSEYLPEELYDLGAISFVTKPFSIESIYKTIISHFVDDLSIKDNSVFEDDLSCTLSEPFNLPIEHFGLGGVFLPMSHDKLISEEYEPKKLIRFYLNSPLDASKTCECVGEIMWRRSNSEQLHSGLGIKIVNGECFKDSKYINFVMDNNIYSFIPLGRKPA
jgi:DNA-binding NarL/FixJ family response regulator